MGGIHSRRARVIGWRG